MKERSQDVGEHFEFIESQRRQLKEQIARALLRAVRIERLLMSIEENAESAIRELKERLVKAV